MTSEQATRVLNAIRSEQWLITDEWYERIVEIASRENTLTPEMISSLQAQRAANSDMTTMYGDTAVVDLTGPVFRYANLFTMISSASSTTQFSSELGRLNADSKVKRIIVRYDSPGGVASGAAEMSTQIRNIDKPHIAFATGNCCSLAYFWASQGHQVWVAEDAIVGNIGTRTKAPQGQQEDDLVSKGAPNKILTRQAMSDVLNSLENVFINHVAMGRGVSADDVRERFGQGGVFVGADAVNAGLADYTGTLDKILGSNFANTRSTKQSNPIGTFMNNAKLSEMAENDPCQFWNQIRNRDHKSNDEVPVTSEEVTEGSESEDDSDKIWAQRKEPLSEGISG